MPGLFSFRPPAGPTPLDPPVKYAAPVQAGSAAPVVAPPVVTPTTYSATKSYTTTPQDYTAKCGAGTSGTAVTRSATKGGYSTQLAADDAALAQAKSDALAAIVCPVPLPSYDTTLDAGNSVADGMLLAPANSQKLLFNSLSNTSGNSIAMQITDSSDGSVSYVTFNDEYKNRGYAFIKNNGSRYDGTYPTSDQNLTV